MALAPGLLTGFVSGAIKYTEDGTPILLPFPKVVEATLSYSSELVIAETANQAGIFGASRACLTSESGEITLNTSDIEWSALQVSVNSRAQAATAAFPVSEEFYLTQVDGVSGNSVFTLSRTPDTDAAALALNGLPSVGLLVTTFDGEVVTPTLTGSDVELDADLTGQRVTVLYLGTPVAGSEEIEIGGESGRITQGGLYGQFKGCPGTLKVVAQDVSFAADSQVTTSAGNSPTVGVTATLLRGNKGYFARIISEEQS